MTCCGGEESAKFFLRRGLLLTVEVHAIQFQPHPRCSPAMRGAVQPSGQLRVRSGRIQAGCERCVRALPQGALQAQHGGRPRPLPPLPRGQVPAARGAEQLLSARGDAAAAAAAAEEKGAARSTAQARAAAVSSSDCGCKRTTDGGPDPRTPARHHRPAPPPESVRCWAASGRGDRAARRWLAGDRAALRRVRGRPLPPPCGVDGAAAGAVPAVRIWSVRRRTRRRLLRALPHRQVPASAARLALPRLQRGRAIPHAKGRWVHIRYAVLRGPCDRAECGWWNAVCAVPTRPRAACAGGAALRRVCRGALFPRTGCAALRALPRWALPTLRGPCGMPRRRRR